MTTSHDAHPWDPVRRTTRAAMASATRSLRQGVHAASSARTAHQDRPYRAIHERFRDESMISAAGYVANLRLAESIGDLEGDVVECGTWRGGMIAGIATLLGDERHAYHLFDSFEGLPPVQEVDGAAAAAWQANAHGDPDFDNCAAEQSRAAAAMARSGSRRFEIHPGWFADTLPGYAATEPTIAILRLDGDWFESTLTCLRELHRFVVPGGLVIIDDYDPWDGCARAVHTYLAESASTDRLDRFRRVAFLRRRAD